MDANLAVILGFTVACYAAFFISMWTRDRSK